MSEQKSMEQTLDDLLNGKDPELMAQIKQVQERIKLDHLNLQRQKIEYNLKCNYAIVRYNCKDKTDKAYIGLYIERKDAVALSKGKKLKDGFGCGYRLNRLKGYKYVVEEIRKEVKEYFEKALAETNKEIKELENANMS